MDHNDNNFNGPQRQSYAAIIFLAYKYFKITISTLWPLALAFLVGKGSYKNLVLWAFIAGGILILIYTVIDFLRYYFYISDDELIVEKGVFKRSRINIPFERIQTINFEQSILHQALNVVKVEVDTAGSKGNEFTFLAFQLPKAEALRRILMEKKSVLQNEILDNEYKDTPPIQQKDQLILSLSIKDLLRVGITQNHIKSLFLILAFFISIYSNIDDAGIDTSIVNDNINKEMILTGKKGIIYLVLFSIIFSFLYSLFRTVFLYYQFSLLRSSDSFKVISGLFTKKQIAAKDKKIQIIEWNDNLLKRILGIHNVHLKQASSIAVSDKNSIIIPGCNRSVIEKIKNYYFESTEWDDLKEFRISKKIIFYKTLWYGIFPALLSLALLINQGYYSVSLLILIWPVLVFYAAKVSHKKRIFSINNHILHLQHGLFGNYNEALKLSKIQSVSLRQSLFQRRNRLANIIIYTASGKLIIPFTDLIFAQNAVNYFMYKVESDNKTWM